MKRIFTFLLLALSLNGICQDAKFPEWTAAEVKKANTAAGVAQINDLEREVIYLMNLARLNGAKFWNTYMTKHLNGANNSYISSLKRDLQGVSNLPMLYPDAGLCKAAKYHAGDMAKNNFFDHNSYDGTGCFTRLKRYYSSGTAAENISAGKKTAIGIVAQLLVDDNTPSLGHRKNILNRNYNAVGVACATHKSYQYCCVQDFGDRVLNAMQGSGGTSNDKNNNGGGGKLHKIDGNGGGNGGGNRPNNGGKTGPKFPDINNIQEDERWVWEDELAVWVYEQDPYIFMYDVSDGIKLYYDSRNENFYIWDDSSRQWILYEDDEDE